MDLRHVAAVLALLLTLGVAEGDGWAKGASLAEATPEQKESASSYYQSAAKALESKALEAALTGFQASYDVVASPNSHFMIVQVLEMLGRTAEAYNELLVVIAEAEAARPLGEKYGKTSEVAQERLEQLRPRVGLVQVDVSAEPTAKLTVGGYVVDRSRWGMPIAAVPGKVSVVLEGPSGRREQEVEVMGGELKTISLALAKADTSEFDTEGAAKPAKPKPEAGPEIPGEKPGPEGPDEPGGSILLPVGIAAGAVGVVGFVLTGVFGSMAQSEYDALAAECGAAGCAPERSSEADTGRTFQTLSNVMLVVGAVGVAAGAGLVIYSFTGGSDEGGDAAATASVALGPGSVLLRGTF